MKTKILIATASLLLFSHILPAADVTFTFEGGNNGSTFGVEYGSHDSEGQTALYRDGFIVDVLPHGHFHETDSTLNPKVPDRPTADRGVLWSDNPASQNPIVFTRAVSTTVFSLQSLDAGSTTADGSQTTGVRVSAYLGGGLVGTVDLITPTNAYTTYSGAALGALLGLNMDRLEFVGLSSSSVNAEYMLDTVVLRVDDALPPAVSIASYAGIQITGTVGATYRVQYTLDLANAIWTNLADVPLPASPYIHFDPLPINQTPRRFYRALLLNP